MGHAFDGPGRRVGQAGDVKFVELAAQMRPARGDRDGTAASWIGKTPVGAVTIALEKPGKAREMTFGTCAAAAVLEAVGDHGRTGTAERPIVLCVGPQPGRLRAAIAGCQCRQRRLVGEDAVAISDQRENTVGERLQVEADAAHSAGHDVAADRDVVPGVDRLLPIQR